MSETKPKFTPGPWVVSHRCSGAGWHDDETFGLGWELEGPPEPMLRGMFAKAADAHLIASAPNLYAALEDELKMRTSAIKAIEAHHNGTLSLEEFEHVITGIFTGSFVGDLTRAALSKARGEHE